MHVLAARQVMDAETVQLTLQQCMRTVLHEWHRDGPIIGDVDPAATYFAARLEYELVKSGLSLMEASPGDVFYFDACLNCNGTGVELTRSTNRAFDCPQCDGTGRAQNEGKVT